MTYFEKVLALMFAAMIVYAVAVSVADVRRNRR